MLDRGPKLLQPGDPVPADLLDRVGYAVWVAPGSRRDLVGVHIGVGCWWRVQEHLAGGAYESGRDHLKSAAGVQALLHTYASQRAKWGTPVQPAVWLWR